MLKFVLSHGMILKRTHRILKFVQSKWLKPYIELNTNQRNKPNTNTFDRNLFKLMSNSICGKSIENVRDRVDIVLRTEWHGRHGAKHDIVSPRLKKCTVFSENFVAIEMQKTLVYMDKPVFIGFTVLEESKLKMYSFHYDEMLKRFENDVGIYRY